VSLLTASWNSGSARLALLMYADAGGQVHLSKTYMEWRTVQSATMAIDLCCVEGQKSGGVWIVNGMCGLLLANSLLISTDLLFPTRQRQRETLPLI